MNSLDKSGARIPSFSLRRNLIESAIMTIAIAAAFLFVGLFLFGLV